MQATGVDRRLFTLGIIHQDVVGRQELSNSSNVYRYEITQEEAIKSDDSMIEMDNQEYC